MAACPRRADRLMTSLPVHMTWHSLSPWVQVQSGGKLRSLYKEHRDDKGMWGSGCWRVWVGSSIHSTSTYVFPVIWYCSFYMVTCVPGLEMKPNRSFPTGGKIILFYLYVLLTDKIIYLKLKFNGVSSYILAGNPTSPTCYTQTSLNLFIYSASLQYLWGQRVSRFIIFCMKQSHNLSLPFLTECLLCIYLRK
jgi:hypothetical protein